jgi:hypothetical protein
MVNVVRRTTLAGIGHPPFLREFPEVVIPQTFVPTACELNPLKAEPAVEV